jgi:hypothetical protein
MWHRIVARRTRVVRPFVAVAIAAVAVVALFGAVSALATASHPSGSGGAGGPGHGRPHSVCASFVSTGGGRCGNSGPVVLSARERLILSRKNALAVEYARVRAGTLSFAAFLADQREFISQYAGPTLSRRTSSSDCPSLQSGPDALCGSNRVPLVQQSQDNSYYCGPAAASEVLDVRGVSASQSTLAGNNYLKTDANGQTSWNPYVMGPTLNTLTNSSAYVAVNGSGVGGGFSQATWQNDLIYDVDNGWAVAGNIVEYANTDPHLVGHPRTVTIYHWIGIYGYLDYGTFTSYADSIHGDSSIWSWAVNVPAYSWIPSSDMTTLLNQRGFVW